MRLLSFFNLLILLHAHLGWSDHEGPDLRRRLENTDSPTPMPTDEPTPQPSRKPSVYPTAFPTKTRHPSVLPTGGPTGVPSKVPSSEPTHVTSQPTLTAVPTTANSKRVFVSLKYRNWPGDRENLVWQTAPHLDSSIDKLYAGDINVEEYLPEDAFINGGDTLVPDIDVKYQVQVGTDALAQDFLEWWGKNMDVVDDSMTKKVNDMLGCQKQKENGKWMTKYDKACKAVEVEPSDVVEYDGYESSDDEMNQWAVAGVITGVFIFMTACFVFIVHRMREKWKINYRNSVAAQPTDTNEVRVDMSYEKMTNSQYSEMSNKNNPLQPTPSNISARSSAAHPDHRRTSSSKRRRRRPGRGTIDKSASSGLMPVYNDSRVSTASQGSNIHVSPRLTKDQIRNNSSNRSANMS